MDKLKMNEIRVLSDSALKERLDEAERELATAKFQIRSGDSKKVRVIRSLRTMRARFLTEQRVRTQKTV